MAEGIKFFYYKPPFRIDSSEKIPPLSIAKKFFLGQIEKLKKDCETLQALLSPRSHSYKPLDYPRQANPYSPENRLQGPDIIDSKDEQNLRSELNIKKERLIKLEELLQKLKEIESLSPEELIQRREQLMNRLKEIESEGDGLSEKIKLAEEEIAEKKEKSILYRLYSFAFKNKELKRLKRQKEELLIKHYKVSQEFYYVCAQCNYLLKGTSFKDKMGDISKYGR